MKYDKVIAEKDNKIIYQDGDKCVKVFHSECSKEAVFKEAMNHAIIEGIGIKVPALYEVKNEDNGYSITSEYINGKTLAKLIEENPQKKEEYLNLMVDLQLEIHGMTCVGLEKLKDSLHDRICQSDFTATIRFDLHTRLKEADNYNHVCHGNFTPENIIVAESGEVYVVDWSKAVRGVGLADAAATYLSFWMKGDIGGAQKYMEMFCEKNGTEKKDIRKWLPIVAAANSVQCNEKEKVFLQSLVIDGDYE